MKTKYFSTSWGGFLLLMLAAVIIYAATPTPSVADCPGCTTVSIVVQNDPYYDWETPCRGVPDPTNAYQMSPCNGAEATVLVNASAIPCSGTPSSGTYAVVTSGSVTNEIITQSPIMNDNGTPMWIAYRVFVKPGQEKKYGTFTVTATAGGCFFGTNGQAVANQNGKNVVEYQPDACSSCSSLGSCSANTGCMDFRLFLGKTQFKEDAGVIWFNAENSSTTLSQPVFMQVPFQRSGVTVIKTNGAVRQIKVPEGLVNVVSNSPYSYDLQFFYAADVGSQGSDGLYITNGAAFTTWTVNNPDTNQTSSRLFFTENRGGVIRQFQYSNYVANAEWDLTNPDGHVESMWSAAVIGSTPITNEYRQISFAGQILSKTQNTYSNVAAIGQRLLMQEILGNDSFRTNTYTYYSDGATNRLQLAIYGEGDWKYYVYDAYGRVIREYSAYNNGAPPTSGEPDTSTDPCKLIAYTYANYTNSIPQEETLSLPVYNGSYWEMHQVSKTDRDVNAAVEDTKRYINPEADSSPFLETIVNRSTVADYTLGLPLSIQNEDGTTNTFSYPDAWTTIEYLPNGSQTTTIIDDLRNLVSQTNLYGSVVLSSENRIYTNGSGAYLDGLRRSYDSIDLAGRKTQVRYYDCCGYSTVTDPDGAVTQYDFDSLKRQIASTVSYGGPGIKTTNVLDAAGRALVTQRIGTNGGSPMTLQQYQYDTLGNVTRQTNALGGVTTIAKAIINNQLYVTNTYADGGTRIEIYQRDGRLQSVTGTAVQGVQYTYDVEQDPLDSSWREVTTETKLNGGSTTSEWVKRFSDGLGRRYLTQFAAPSTPYPGNRSFYNDQGHLWKQMDADTNITLYTYYDSGTNFNRSSREYTITALSTTARGITDYGTLVTDLGTLQSGIDRLTRQYESVVSASGVIPDLIETDTYAWTNSENDGTGTLISSTAVSTTGLTNWMTQYANASASVTSQSRMQYTGTGHSMVSIAPDGSYTTNWYPYGRLASATKYDSTPTLLGQTTNSYDVHGRTYQTADLRNGATTYGYNNADQISSITTPNPGSGGSAETTTTYFNAMLQVTNVVQPDGTSVTNEYFPTGELKKTYGSRTYPVAYTYDYAGRMNTMLTWQNFSALSGTNVTSWAYDAYRGFLVNKMYGTISGPSYTYTPSGRLKTRLWARGITTIYNYDYAGGLTNVAYSDGATSSVTNIFDRLGRITQVGMSNQVCQYQYDLVGDLLVETNTAGLLAGLAVTNGYDQYLRRTNLVTRGSGILSQTAYSYTNDSRLWTVSDGTNNATYSYVANSPLVSQITFKSNSVTAMTTTKQYDYLNRLTLISNAPTASPAVSYNYSYNTANQRTQDTLLDGSYWIYQYDSLGQVTSGKKYWRDGTPVAGQQFEYTFDDIGNRKQTKSGGDDTGSNLRLANYTNNSLNQITGKDVPGYVDVMGIALATNTVTVNGQSTYRKGEYFRDELIASNAITAVWTNLIVASPGQTSVTGNKYIPQTAEIFAYDADGNLTNDGRWNYVWDGENRLIKMTVNTNVGPQYQLLFTYDSKGRRVQKYVLTNSVAIYTNRFLYDGWNLIGVLTPSSKMQLSYTWGSDLSGSVRGAGGVGGLLMINPGATNCFVGYDGNGNIALLSDTAGANRASYEYGPFGEVIRATGSMAKANAFRFSSKYQDDESDHLYYGYRFYNPSLGKWLSRDCTGERGGLGLYCFLVNRPVDAVDFLGLQFEFFLRPSIVEPVEEFLPRVAPKPRIEPLPPAPEPAPAPAPAPGTGSGTRLGLPKPMYPPAPFVPPLTDPDPERDPEHEPKPTPPDPEKPANQRCEGWTYYHYSPDPGLAGQGLPAEKWVTDAANLTRSEALAISHMEFRGNPTVVFRYPVCITRCVRMDYEGIVNGHNQWLLRTPTGPGSIGIPSVVPPDNL